jgi:hypothetical protein
VNITFTVTSEYKSDQLLFKRFTIYDKANGQMGISRSEISPQDSFDMEF